MKISISCRGIHKSWNGYEPTSEEIGKAVAELYETAKYNNFVNFTIKLERKED